MINRQKGTYDIYGKEGKVLKVLKSENRVIIEGLNKVKKHVKPSAQNETGGILEIEAPIHISNVKVVDKKEIVEENSRLMNILKNSKLKTED